MKATIKVLEVKTLPERKDDAGNVLPKIKTLRLSVLAHNPFARPEIHWTNIPDENPIKVDDTFEVETNDFSARMKETKAGFAISAIKVQTFKY